MPQSGTIPQTDVPPCGMSKVDVQQLAEKVAKAVAYTPNGDLNQVVKKLGGEIIVEDSFEDLTQSGSIRVKGPSSFVIYLASFTGHLRDRFTIAHELGHYVLHSRFGQTPIWVARGGSGRTEWEANWFAAGFLMPETEFRNLEQRPDFEIAQHFGVSEQAVSVRRQSLNG